jgi:hypothetical protein
MNFIDKNSIHPSTPSPRSALNRWFAGSPPVTKSILQTDSRKTDKLVLRDRINTLYKDYKMYIQRLRLYFYIH